MSDWQDISTAPKDGSELILWANGLYVGRWGDLLYASYEGAKLVKAYGWVAKDTYVAQVREPTHWQKPEAPTPPAPHKPE